jgi:hypothetical protein
LTERIRKSHKNKWDKFVAAEGQERPLAEKSSKAAFDDSQPFISGKAGKTKG